MVDDEIIALEQKIHTLTCELNALKQTVKPTQVPNYTFRTLEGKVSLLDLFAGQDTLILVHNMGQGCRYCTMWGDGINAVLPHVESMVQVVMVSKDSPESQRRFANSRGWRFRMASHQGSRYIAEQSVVESEGNYPGVVAYRRQGDQVMRLNASPFGPGDLYCIVWNLLGVAGLDAQAFTPQFNYWQRPETLDDGGDNILA